MLIVTAVGLYTVKITLKALGVIDYGIYNVVASVVASLGFLNGTLTSATQRFLSFHLGKNDYASYSKTFSLLLMGFIVISVVIFMIGEGFSFFFIDKLLDIPQDKHYAAQWVYQTAIVTFIFHLLLVPYTSSIVANEKMSAFAYISIVDCGLKLILVYLLLLSSKDRLIYYGILTMIESIIIFALYVIYCHKAFRYCRFKLVWDKSLFKELTSYTGWNLFGSISSILITQGQNILLNIFFGPVINTAKAIADRINSVVSSFSTNFYMAVTPQIIKSYAYGEQSRMITLAISSSRFSFFLLLLVSFPLVVCMKSILVLWLGARSVTNEMVEFSKLSLLFCLITCLEQPITQMIRATGEIKSYQMKVGIFTLLYIPIAAIVLYFGAPPISTMIVLIILYSIIQIIRVRVAHAEIKMNYKIYNKEVTRPICIVFIISLILYKVFEIFCYEESLWEIIKTGLVSFLSILIIIWTLGLTKVDRTYIVSILKNKILNFN